MKVITLLYSLSYNFEFLIHEDNKKINRYQSLSTLSARNPEEYFYVKEYTTKVNYCIHL